MAGIDFRTGGNENLYKSLSKGANTVKGFDYTEAIKRQEAADKEQAALEKRQSDIHKTGLMRGYQSVVDTDIKAYQDGIADGTIDPETAAGRAALAEIEGKILRFQNMQKDDKARMTLADTKPDEYSFSYQYTDNESGATTDAAGSGSMYSANLHNSLNQDYANEEDLMNARQGVNKGLGGALDVFDTKDYISYGNQLFKAHAAKAYKQNPGRWGTIMNKSISELVDDPKTGRTDRSDAINMIVESEVGSGKLHNEWRKMNSERIAAGVAPDTDFKKWAFNRLDSIIPKRDLDKESVSNISGALASMKKQNSNAKNQILATETGTMKGPEFNKFIGDSYAYAGYLASDINAVQEFYRREVGDKDNVAYGMSDVGGNKAKMVVGKSIGFPSQFKYMNGSWYVDLAVPKELPEDFNKMTDAQKQSYLMGLRPDGMKLQPTKISRTAVENWANSAGKNGSQFVRDLQSKANAPKDGEIVVRDGKTYEAKGGTFYLKKQ
jgi:hypothetical protein